MTLHQRDASNTLVEIGGYFVRDATNALVEIGEEWVRDETNTLRLVYSSSGSVLTLDYPFEAYGGGASASEIIVSTTSVTVTVTGGREPYSYLWTLAGDPDSDWVISAPTNKTTAFRRLGVAAGAAYSTDFICTVTDDNGSTAVTDAITANVLNYGDLGGLLP